MARSYFIIIFFILLSAISVNAQVYVKSDATGSNNGSSWQNAYTNLDSAISQTASGEIWICKGTYKPSKTATDGEHTFKTFFVNKSLQFLGGFAGTETSASQRDYKNNVTILSGDIGVPGDSTDNASRIMMVFGVAASATVIDGFTFTKAWTNVSSESGAVYFQYATTPVLRNCIITGNTGYAGAGVYVDGSSPVINNNTIINNRAARGAGILVSGGNPVISNNKIMFNVAIGLSSIQSGGGIFVESQSIPLIYNNLIENNIAWQEGGGICLYTPSSETPIIIKNNVFSNNTALYGGGIFTELANIEIINNLVVNNHARDIGGGIYGEDSKGLLVNNSIANNTASGLNHSAGGLNFYGVDLQIVNNIVYNNHSYNGKPIVVMSGPVNAYPRFKYSDIQGGIDSIEFINITPVDSIWQQGNITSVPAFVDTGAYDFHLSNLSACIDAGKPDTSLLHLPVSDLYGNPRYINNRVDMGCYESGTAYSGYVQVNPDSVKLAGWRDSTFNLSIQAGVPWNIYNTAGWISLSSSQGTGNTAVAVTAYKNTDLINARSTSLLVSGAGNIPSVPVNINQSYGGYFFIPDTLFINGNLDDSASIFINSNLNWYIDSYPNSWLQFNVVGGTTGQVITAKARNSNTTNNIRQDIIIFHYGNALPGFTKTMVVVQTRASAKLCPGGNTSFSSGLSGGTYQWQLDSGSGFSSISDGTNYSGTNTSILQLNNLPSSFYGYKYRCISGTGYSNVFSVIFENTWTGSAGNAWENPLNWSCGVVPDAGTDVVIFSGNIYINANTVIRKLTVNSFAHVFIQPGVNLTILH